MFAISGLAPMCRALMIVLALMAAGCSSIDLGAAKALGETGVTGSTKLRDDATNLEQLLGRHEEHLLLTKASAISLGCEQRKLDYAQCAKMIGELKPDANAEKLEKLRTVVEARAVTFEVLLENYQAFLALAEYNAAEEAEKAAGNLIAQTQSFVDTVNTLLAPAVPLSAIGRPAGEIIKIGVGLAAEERQKREVKNASVVLREAVAVLKQGVDAEKDAFSSLKTVENAIRNEAIKSLREDGLVNYGDIVSDVAKGLGVKSVDNADEVIAKHPRLRVPLGALIDYRARKEDKLVRSAYTDLISALEKLIQEHHKLEEGKPMDLAELRRLIAKASGYFQRVKQADKDQGEKS